MLQNNFYYRVYILMYRDEILYILVDLLLAAKYSFVIT